MCVSDEPGYYHEGEFGIRIENVIMVVRHPTHENFYKFENLTYAPYSKELIDTKLLTQSDVEYLNNFHKKVSLIYFQ
jgi:Xaa-Pro aminopeptidase